MSTPNFASVLDKPASEIERPKPLPVGTYLTVIKGLPRFDKSSKKQTDFVEFTHEFVAAKDDVDAQALEEMGGCQGKTMTNTYYLTEASAWRLKEFLEHCGFDLSDPDVTMRQAIEETPNTQVYVTIRHEPSQDGKSIFARIGGTASAQ